MNLNPSQKSPEAEDEQYFSIAHGVIRSGFGAEMKLVLLVLCAHTNSLGETDSQSDEALAAQTGLDLHTIGWVMAQARESGWIVDDPAGHEYTLTVGSKR